MLSHAGLEAELLFSQHLLDFPKQPVLVKTTVHNRFKSLTLESRRSKIVSVPNRQTTS
jgi:hypothetical protein